MAKTKPPKETKPAKVEILAMGHSPRDTEILINGADISTSVAGATLKIGTEALHRLDLDLIYIRGKFTALAEIVPHIKLPEGLDQLKALKKEIDKAIKALS